MPKDAIGSESLIRDIKAGKRVEQNAKLLFDLYAHRIFCFFSKQGCSHEDCNDLTQEVFLRVYRGITGFRGEASFETWLLGIASNVWKNALRYQHTPKRSAALVSLEEVLESLPADDPPAQDWPEPAIHATQLDDTLGHEGLWVLRRALLELPPQMRRCLLLRIGQSLKYREIAEIMLISVNTVKSQINQGRERLKVSLRDYFPDVDFSSF